MFHGQGKEKSCPLNSVVKTNELLCQGYIMYWCYASNIQPQEEKKKQTISLQLLNLEMVS